MFGRLVNLYRIQKLYKLIKEKDKLNQAKHWVEIFKTALSIEEVRDMLAGYKTYIVAILTAAVTLLHSLGYIDDNLKNTLLGLLAAGGIGTVAAKVNRIQNEINASKGAPTN